MTGMMTPPLAKNGAAKALQVKAHRGSWLDGPRISYPKFRAGYRHVEAPLITGPRCTCARASSRPSVDAVAEFGLMSSRASS